MIEVTYAKKILNALFRTGGRAGLLPDDEKAQLEAEGVVWGVTPQQYFLAFRNDGYKIGDNTEEYNNYRTIIDNSSNFETKSVGPETFTYAKLDSNGEPIPNSDPIKKAFSGWTVIQKAEQIQYYPSAAYLALFTKMPDEFGDNYKEPIEDEEGNVTTYMRVDLHADIVLGDVSVANAAADENGISTLVNNNVIMFPEVSDIGWGTIVGIGIFETKSGEGKPVYWGRLLNSEVADPNHVPLLRIGEFKLTLS